MVVYDNVIPLDPAVQNGHFHVVTDVRFFIKNSFFHQRQITYRFSKFGVVALNRSSFMHVRADGTVVHESAVGESDLSARLVLFRIGIAHFQYCVEEL